MALKIGSLLKNLRKPSGLIQNPVSKSVSKAANIHQSFGGIKGVNKARAAMNEARTAVVANKTPSKPNNLNQNNKKKNQINTDSLKKDPFVQKAMGNKVGEGAYDPKTNTLIDSGTDITIGGSKEPEKEVTDHEQEKAKKPGRLRDALREVVYGLSLLPGPLQGIGAQIVDARKERKKELENDALEKAKKEAGDGISSGTGYGQNSKIIPATREEKKKPKKINPQQRRKFNKKVEKKPTIIKRQVTT